MDYVLDGENLEFYLKRAGYSLAEIDEMDIGKAIRMSKRMQTLEVMNSIGTYLRAMGERESSKPPVYPDSWLPSGKRKLNVVHFDISDVIIKK